MGRKFEIKADVAKKNRFDIFGWFETTGTMSPEEQAQAAPALAKEWMDQHYKNLGLGRSEHKVLGYKMEGSKFVVKIESV